MANEIFIPAMTPGDVIYVVEFNAAGEAWNPTSAAFVTYTDDRGDFVMHRTTVGANGNFGPFNSQTLTTKWLAFVTLQGSGDESASLDYAAWEDGPTRALDGNGNALATKAEQDKIPKSDGSVAPNATAVAAMQSGLALAATALSSDTWTSTLASYLANLNIGGPVASQADVAAITVASRIRIVPPLQMERPDDETPITYRVWIYHYGPTGLADDLDANPTVAAENNTGANRSGNLGTVTKPGGTTGQYYVDYTVAQAHAIEGLVFKVTAEEEEVETVYSAPSWVVDTTAVDFTAADRIDLQAAKAAAEAAESQTENVGGQVWDHALSLPGEAMYPDDAVTAGERLQWALQFIFQAKTNLGSWNANPSTGENALLHAMQSLFRSDVPVPSVINIDFGSGVGTANSELHSQQALREKLPENLESLGINESGHLARVVLVDTTTSNSDMRGTDDALTVGGYTAPDNAAIGDAKAAAEAAAGILAATTEHVGEGEGYRRYKATALEAGPVFDGEIGDVFVDLTGVYLRFDTLDTAVGNIEVGQAEAASFDNTDVVPARVFELGDRRDGIARANGKLRMLPNEKYPVWVRTRRYTGPQNLKNISAPASTGIALYKSGLHDDMVVFGVSSNGASVGDKWVVSAKAHPSSGSKLTVELEVEVVASSP